MATAETPLLAGLVPESPPQPDTANDEVENSNRPKGLTFAVVYACILMGDFVVGYDTSCVATLTPVITDEFHAIDDLGWYGIAYLLAMVSTLLTFGQLYTIYPLKTIFLASFSTFAIGSLVSASASSSAFFIAGRAISGLGGSGVFAGGSIIVANTTPLKHRPIYQAISGGMECVALSIGPLVAGVIAQASSWRVAFYIIVPVAICNIAAIGFFVDGLPQPKNANLKTVEKYRQLDVVGFILFVPATVCLVLALQWGGTVYTWRDSHVVVLLVLAILLAAAFGFSQLEKGDGAMFPLHLLKQRSVSIGSFTQFCVSASLFVYCFYLPIYFQTLRAASPFTSGLMYLPTTIPFALAIFFAGNLTSYIGYYTPVSLAGTLLLSVGGGLITTFSRHTPPAQWITYQILFGTGAGLAFQQSYTAIQTVLPEEHVATAIVVLSFTQEMGGIVGLAVAQNVFLSRLTSRLTDAVPGMDLNEILKHGTLGVPDIVPDEFRKALYQAYSETIVDVFRVGLVAACATICALGIEWRSVKEEKEEGGGVDAES